MRLAYILSALSFTLLASAANIVGNPGFEVGGTAGAAGWQTHVARGQYTFEIAPDAHSGERCAAIRPLGEAGWARWYTTDLYLLAGAQYHLSAWVKTGEGGVAEVWVPGDGGGFLRSITDAAEWTLVEGDLSVAKTGSCGLYLQSKGTGPVYFDDISVELTQAPPPIEGGRVPTDGAPIVAIVIPDDVLPHHGYLSMDTQRILERMTGEAPAIANASSAPEGRCIWIGVVPPGRSYETQLARVGREGIVLDVDDDAIVCLGNTPRGVYYSVQELYYLLGCRWCWPGPLGEVIPRVPRLSLPPRLVVHSPSFDLRGGHTIQVYHTPPDWAARHVDTGAWVDWAARNRMNRLKASYAETWDYGAIRGGEWEELGGHTLYTILPPDKWFDTHPEFYPLVGDRRTAKHSSGRAAEICCANKELHRVVADFIIEYFDSHPDAERICVNAEDEPSYWCECEACKALDTAEVDWSQNGVECADLTDRWMYFINEVAAMVEERYPDKYIATFAYGSTRETPRKYLPRRNVMIELTWWDQCFKHAMDDESFTQRMEAPSCEINARGMQRFRDWSRLAPVALYRYLDYHHLESPQVFYEAEADILRRTHAGGCRHLSDEWDATFTASALLLNLRARLQWDVHTDVDAFIDGFCRRVYGKAGGHVARFHRRLQRAVFDSPGEHVGFNDTQRFGPEVLAECHEILDMAEAMADDDTILARIDRLRYALLFAELDNVSEAVKEEPDLFPRQSELQRRLLALVNTRKITPILGYYGKLGTTYRPPVAAMKAPKVLQLPEQWLFRTDPEKVGETEQWYAAQPDDNWRPISTLQPWEVQGYEGYDGYGWYTVEVDIPAIEDKPVWLYCEAVDETFDLWINGQPAGGSKGDPALLWDKPVAVDITGKLNPGEKNRLTLRVHDIGHAGGIWKPMWITAG